MRREWPFIRLANDAGLAAAGLGGRPATDADAWAVFWERQGRRKLAAIEAMKAGLTYDEAPSADINGHIDELIQTTGSLMRPLS